MVPPENNKYVLVISPQKCTRFALNGLMDFSAEYFHGFGDVMGHVTISCGHVVVKML